MNFLSVVLRTTGNPTGFADVVREATLATNRNIPIYHVRTLHAVERHGYGYVRFFTQLFAVFGAVALLAAAARGLISFSVPQLLAAGRARRVRAAKIPRLQ